MNLFDNWLHLPWMQALGWTFVHSLWQIALTGLVLYIALRLIPNRSAHIRYTISTMAIWMIVIMALSTFIIMLPDTEKVTEVTGRIMLVDQPYSLSLTQKISLWLESKMPMMLSVWMGGVMILMIRLLLSLVWVSHIRKTGMPSMQLQSTLDKIINCHSLKVIPSVSESGIVSSPVTIGHLKPLILFPIGIINQLTPNEVEAVITHELAHIVRRDYLSNLIQSFIETLFYYHPVTWWISGVVRTERENRADDLAISWYGDHIGYAKALMTVQEMQDHKRPALAIGFASRKGAMLVRIQRILHIPYKNHNQMEKTVLLSLCSLCFLAFTMSNEARHEQEKKADGLLSTTEFTTSIVDTIPSNGTYRIHKKTDDQDINIHVEDGDIKELKIDGKEIQPSDFDNYEEVINELFGEVESPALREGFHYGMPPMPSMPPMPEMVPMAPVPPMPHGEREFEYFFGNGDNVTILRGDGNMKIFCDTMLFNGDQGGLRKKFIIIDKEGDSSAIFVPGHGDHAFLRQLEVEDWGMNEEEMKKLQEELRSHSEQWRQHGEEWQKHAEEWKKNWKENSHGLNELRFHEEAIDKEIRKQLRHENFYIHGEDMPHIELRELQELEGALGELGEARVYGFRSHGANMTEAMVEEGLIEPGEVAEIVLTPERLKINGKKMDAATHERYLRMYEAQQGIELTGNSRVEFRTKSRRSM